MRINRKDLDALGNAFAEVVSKYADDALFNLPGMDAIIARAKELGVGVGFKVESGLAVPMGTEIVCMDDKEPTAPMPKELSADDEAELNKMLKACPVLNKTVN